jgi:hypothetical protein
MEANLTVFQRLTFQDGTGKLRRPVYTRRFMAGNLDDFYEKLNFKKKFGPFSVLFSQSDKNSAHDFPGPHISVPVVLSGQNFGPLATLLKYCKKKKILNKKSHFRTNQS